MNFCQRCGKEITKEERRASCRITYFEHGLCSSCLTHYTPPRGKDEIVPEYEPDGWRIFNNILDYQFAFDGIRVLYNCIELPKSFPCAAYLDSVNLAASFVYIYPDRAQELCIAAESQSEYRLSLGGK